jgi:hypothetical protein
MFSYTVCKNLKEMKIEGLKQPKFAKKPQSAAIAIYSQSREVPSEIVNAIK